MRDRLQNNLPLLVFSVVILVVPFQADWLKERTQTRPTSPPKTSAKVETQPSFDELFEQLQQSDRKTFVFHGPVNAAQLKRLASVKTLETLELYQGHFHSRQLIPFLSNWPQLRRLRLEDCKVDDATLKAIAALSELQILNLPNAKFTDVGLAAIAESPKLSLLRFSSPNVSDAGLTRLAKMPSLRFLHLMHCPITDKGLLAFHESDQLQSLYIDDGNETEDGIRALLRANVKLHFHRNQLHVADDPSADEH